MVHKRCINYPKNIVKVIPSRMSIERAIDEEALKELRTHEGMLRRDICQERLEKAEQLLAKATPGTKEYKSYKLARMCFELVLDMMGPSV
jgi:hypothetical protein